MISRIAFFSIFLFAFCLVNECEAGVLWRLRQRRCGNQICPEPGTKENHVAPAAKVPTLAPEAKRPEGNDTKPPTDDSIASKLTEKIATLSQELSDLLHGKPGIREPYKMDIRQLPASAREEAIQGMKSHVKVLETLKALVEEGKFESGILNTLAIDNFHPSMPLPDGIDNMKGLQIRRTATEEEVRAIIAKLPTKEEIKKIDAEILALTGKIERALPGIQIQANGGQYKTLKDTLEGMKTIERLIPHLEVGPKAVLSIGVSSKLEYSDFSKQISIKPNTTPEELKKLLETVPFAPTDATYAEMGRLKESTKDPLIHKALDKGTEEMKKLEVAGPRKDYQQSRAIKERLGVEYLSFHGVPPDQTKSINERLAKLDVSKIKPNRSVKILTFSTKDALPMDYRGSIQIPADATDDAILAAINATPDKDIWEKQSENVARRLEAAGKSMGPRNYVTLDFSRVTHDEALRAAALVEDLGKKGYQPIAPGKGFWVVSDSTPGWEGARYWDQRHTLIMIGANVTEADLVKGGFIEKK